MNYLIDDEVIEKVRYENDIVEIISQYITLKRTGSNYVGLCPFHNEKTPSFSVSPTKQFYHCFGCGESGDVISFIMQEEKLSFPEAVKFLADKAGIILEEKENMKNIELKKEKEMLYEINKETAKFFYNSLGSNKNGLYYLKRRSIDRKTINKFGIGFANESWDSLYSFLTKRGYKEKDIEKAGLIIKRKNKNGYYDRFRNRIMFPIINTRGDIIAFGGRAIDSSNPKYLNSPDTLVFSKGNNLFGLNIVRKESNRKRIVLVEGYMDVISLYSNGINYAVASLGTAFTSYQGKLLKRFGDEIYICYDSDLAGLKATDRALEILRKEDIISKVLILPKGKDPDDYIKEEGKEKFEALFQSSLNYIDFKIYFYKNKYNLKNVDEKIMFTRDIGKFLNELKSPVERDIYLNKISDETDISKEALKNEFLVKSTNVKSNSKDKYINTNYRNNKDKIIPVKNVLEPAHLTAEKSIISLILRDKKKFEKIKEHIKPEDFMNYEYRQLASFIFSIYEKGMSPKDEDIINFFNTREDVDKELIIEVLRSDMNISEENIDKVIEDLIETINLFKLKLRRKEITKQINDIDKKGEKTEEDDKKFKQLCLELLNIDRELKLHQ